MNTKTQKTNETIHIKEIVKQLVKEMRKKCLFEKEQEKFLTRKEVAEMLKVDLSTVHNWTKKNILTMYGIGGRVYYKENEIRKAMIVLNEDEA